jgi:hypothetical protein
MEADDRLMKSKRRITIRSILVPLLVVAFSANSEVHSDNKLTLKYSDFSHFVRISEKEYKLEWGKDTIRNRSFRTFDSSEVVSCRLVTETDEFTILKINGKTGSGISLFLPLDRKSQEIQYQNALCIDLENRMIIIENSSRDSILIVENFLTKKRVVLGKDFIPCRSKTPYDCIDSLFFYNNKLRFQWITPDKQYKDRKIELKKFKIRLK